MRKFVPLAFARERLCDNVVDLRTRLNDPVVQLRVVVSVNQTPFSWSLGGLFCQDLRLLDNLALVLAFELFVLLSKMGLVHGLDHELVVFLLDLLNVLADETEMVWKQLSNAELKGVLFKFVFLLHQERIGV